MIEYISKNIKLFTFPHNINFIYTFGRELSYILFCLIDIKHMYMYVHSVLSSSANCIIDFQNKNVIQKKNVLHSMMCILMCGVNLSSKRYGHDCNELLTPHLMKTFLHYLRTCFYKKLFSNKRYHFLRFIFILRNLITELSATLLLNLKYCKNIILILLKYDMLQFV